MQLGGFARELSGCKDWKAVRKTDLETTLRKQAEQVAAKRLSQAAHTMGLENQSLSEQENRKVFEETVEKLIGNPAGLWNTI